ALLSPSYLLPFPTRRSSDLLTPTPPSAPCSRHASSTSCSRRQRQSRSWPSNWPRPATGPAPSPCRTCWIPSARSSRARTAWCSSGPPGCRPRSTCTGLSAVAGTRHRIRSASPVSQAGCEQVPEALSHRLPMESHLSALRLATLEQRPFQLPSTALGQQRAAWRQATVNLYRAPGGGGHETSEQVRQPG